MSAEDQPRTTLTLEQLGVVLGSLEPKLQDGFFVEGPWLPEQTEEGLAFDREARQLDLVDGYKRSVGILVTWRQSEEGGEGEAVCLGFSETGIVLRLLADPSIV